MTEGLFKLLEKLKYEQCIVKHFQKILTDINQIIKLTLEGKANFTQEDINNLYQSIGIIIAYSGTDMTTKLSILQNNYTTLINTLKNSAMAPNASTQFIKSIALMLRSFESEAEGELKEFVKRIAQTTLEILTRHSNEPMIRENIIQLLHKIVIIIGAEIAPMLKQFLSLILQQNCDLKILSEVVKLSGQAAHKWKAKAIDFIREVSYFLLQSMTSLGFPSAKVSDIDKEHLELILNYLKYLRAVNLIDVCLLYELSVDRFTMLVQYLGKCVECTVDEQLKKGGLLCIGMIIGGSIGLNLVSENLGTIVNTQPVKTARMPLLLPEYAIHAKILIEMAEEVALKVLEKVNVQSYQDTQTLPDIVVLHYLLCKVDQDNFLKKYEGWVNMRVPTIGYQNVKMSLGGLVEKKMLKEYKDTLNMIVSLIH